MRPPRIAVTGVGVVSALGPDAPATFSALFAGERGILPVTLFDVDGQRSKLAAEVRGLTIADVAPRGQAEEWSRTDTLAVLAAREALAMASAPAAEPLGLAVGATTGGMYEAESVLAGLHAGGEQDAVRRLLSYPLSTSAERVAQVVGGVCHHATVCSACSSGANAIMLGAAWLLSGRCRRVLAGGTDGLCRLTFAGFNALGATDPEPCRPFDLHRAGLNLGEGAAFLVLETEADAVRRDASGARVVGRLGRGRGGSPRDPSPAQRRHRHAPDRRCAPPWGHRTCPAGLRERARNRDTAKRRCRGAGSRAGARR